MSRIRTRAAVVAATVGIVAAPVGIAQAGDGHDGHRHGHAAPPAPAPTPVNAGTFVTKASASNLFEIESSRLALDRSDSADVRRIAEHLIRDHTAAQAQLAATAATVGIQVPEPRLDPQQQAVVAKLSELEGEAFDAAYLEAQVVAHEQAIALFVGFASKDENPKPLRDLAIATLPILGSHLGEVHAALADREGHGH
jgi:putative membrane protein